MALDLVFVVQRLRPHDLIRGENVDVFSDFNDFQMYVFVNIIYKKSYVSWHNLKSMKTFS